MLSDYYMPGIVLFYILSYLFLKTNLYGNNYHFFAEVESGHIMQEAGMEPRSCRPQSLIYTKSSFLETITVILQISEIPTES